MVQKEISKEIEPVKETVEELERGFEDTVKAAEKTIKTAEEAGKESRLKKEEAIDKDLKEIAESLNIDVTGKSREEVIEEVKNKIKGLKSERGGDSR